MTEGELIKRVRAEMKDCCNALTSLVFVTKCIVTKIEDLIQVDVTMGGTTSEILVHPDLKKTLRSVEEACPLTTAAEAHQKGGELDHVPYMVKTQFEKDDQWCDKRICRLCSCIGVKRFASYDEKVRHRQTAEHKKRVKEYMEDHWRCVVCSEDCYSKAVMLKHLKTRKHDLKVRGFLDKKDETVAVACEVGRR